MLTNKLESYTADLCDEAFGLLHSSWQVFLFFCFWVLFICSRPEKKEEKNKSELCAPIQKGRETFRLGPRARRFSSRC